MKDRVGRQVILDARTRRLAPGAPIIESSSGTMALGLALVGTYLGHAVHIVTDPRIDPITLAKLREARLRGARRRGDDRAGLAERAAGAARPADGRSGRRVLAAPVLQPAEPGRLPRSGRGATHRPRSPGCAGRLGRQRRFAVRDGAGAAGPDLPDLRVVGVDCVGSVLFGQPDWPQRRQSGLGNSLQPENIDYSLIDEVHWLSDDEAFGAARATRQRAEDLRRATPPARSTGCSATWPRTPRPGPRWSAIFPDRGDRYVGSVYRGEPGRPAASR